MSSWGRLRKRKKSYAAPLCGLIRHVDAHHLRPSLALKLERLALGRIKVHSLVGFDGDRHASDRQTVHLVTVDYLADGQHAINGGRGRGDEDSGTTPIVRALLKAMIERTTLLATRISGRARFCPDLRRCHSLSFRYNNPAIRKVAVFRFCRDLVYALDAKIAASSCPQAHPFPAIASQIGKRRPAGCRNQRDANFLLRQQHLKHEQ